MSGHNKWSQIKHKKAVVDSKRSQLFSKHAKNITNETKKAGGDVSAAGVLAAIERAKKDSMPKDNIEKALLRGQKLRGNDDQEIIFEGFGPEGVAILVVTETDNNNRTAPIVKKIFSKHNCSFGSPGSASWAFTRQENTFEPINKVTASDKTKESLNSLIEELEECDDVEAVYTTAE